jgi:hypothetical protein
MDTNRLNTIARRLAHYASELRVTDNKTGKPVAGQCFGRYFIRLDKDTGDAQPGALLALVMAEAAAAGIKLTFDDILQGIEHGHAANPPILHSFGVRGFATPERAAELGAETLAARQKRATAMAKVSALQAKARAAKAAAEARKAWGVKGPK